MLVPLTRSGFCSWSLVDVLAEYVIYILNLLPTAEEGTDGRDATMKYPSPWLIISRAGFLAVVKGAVDVGHFLVDAVSVNMVTDHVRVNTRTRENLTV